MTILTWNILNRVGGDWPPRRERVWRLLADAGADFICLQEAMPAQLAQTMACPDLRRYRVIGHGREPDDRAPDRLRRPAAADAESPSRDEFCPVLYDAARWRCCDAGDAAGLLPRTFWYSADPARGRQPGARDPDASFPRICTWARFQRDDGARVAVCNTHFEHTSPAPRLRAARQLLEHAASIEAAWPGTPVVVAGDLNAEPNAPELAALLGVLRRACPDDPTWQDFAGSPPMKIDYVLVGGGVEVDACERLDCATPPGSDWARPRLSDHWPLRARLRLARA